MREAARTTRVRPADPVQGEWSTKLLWRRNGRSARDAPGPKDPTLLRRDYLRHFASTCVRSLTSLMCEWRDSAMGGLVRGRFLLCSGVVFIAKGGEELAFRKIDLSGSIATKALHLKEENLQL